MFKQDYEALATLINVQRSDQYPIVDVVLDEVARDMAQYLSRNQNFDEAKFLAAAGVS